ncbi:MAG TPA: TIR domain-containing protein [Terriglobales bacterium]|jgi:class 3 adenylate cyclase|nr:TIR domain-containing protein [Terriglobales bacterium]
MTQPIDILTIDDLLELLNTAKQLASEVSLPELLDAILARAQQLTDAPDASIFLYDNKRESLYFAAATGEKGPMLLREFGEFSDKRIPLHSKAGTVFSTGKSIIVDSLAQDPEHYKGVDQRTAKETESMVCVPLAIAEQTLSQVRRVGAIQLLNKRSGNFTERDRVLLEYFSDQAAIAIQNASLFRNLLSHMGLNSSRAAKELVDELNAPAHSETLTLFFADMRGFTQVCQVLNDEEVQKLLSSFLSAMTEEILENGGVVNKLLGDGVLAFFRQGDGAPRAVKCAFNMIEKFLKLRDEWDNQHNQDLSFLDIGFGIVTDKVTLGAIGSGRVRDFTAIGPAVNLAAAFEKKARGGKRVLVNQATWARVQDIVGEVIGPSTFELRKPDQQVVIPYKMYEIVNLKNVSQGLPPSRPRSLSDPLKVFLCHSSSDKPKVRQLYRRLITDHFQPWLDEEDLLPGQDWHVEIRKAVGASDIVIVCLSKGSVAKTGFLNKELQYALDIAEQQPEGRIFIIPLRLEQCDVPDRLTKWQWVNFFEETGYEKLNRALNLRSNSLASVATKSSRQ